MNRLLKITLSMITLISLVIVTLYTAFAAPILVQTNQSAPSLVACNVNGYNYCSNNTLFNVYVKSNSNWGDGIKYCALDNGTERCFIYQSSDFSYRDNNTAQDYITSIGGVTAVINGLTLSYPGIHANVTLNYTITSTGIKEDYIISSKVRNYSASLSSQPITLDFGGYIKFDAGINLTVNGSIMSGNFKTNQKINFVYNNKTLFYLPKPYAISANGSTTNSSYEVYYNGGQIWFYIRTPASWLNNAVYPVRIDPTVTIIGTTGTVSYTTDLFQNGVTNNTYDIANKTIVQTLKFPKSAIPSSVVFNVTGKPTWLLTGSVQVPYGDSWGITNSKDYVIFSSRYGDSGLHIYNKTDLAWVSNISFGYGNTETNWPMAIWADNTTNLLYMGGFYGGSIAVYNLSNITGGLVQNITTFGTIVDGVLDITTDNAYVYICGWGNYLKVYNKTTYSLVSDPLPHTSDYSCSQVASDEARSMLYISDGNRFYVLNRTNNFSMIMNTSWKSEGVAFDDNFIYVDNQNITGLTIYNKSLAPTTNISYGQSSSYHVEQYGDFVYVTGFDASNIIIINKLTQSVEKTIQDPAGAYTLRYMTIDTNNFYFSDSWGNLFRYSHEKYPTDITLDIGNDGVTDYAFAGIFNYTNRTINFATAVTSYLSTCVADANGFCSVPINITASSQGRIRFDGLFQNYTGDESGAFTISDWWLNEINLFQDFNNTQNVTKKYIRTANPSVDLTIDGFTINNSATSCAIYTYPNHSIEGNVVNTSQGNKYCQYSSQRTILAAGGGSFDSVQVWDNTMNVSTAFNSVLSSQVNYTKYINMTAYTNNGSIAVDTTYTQLKNVSVKFTIDVTNFTTDPAISLGIYGSWVRLASNSICAVPYGQVETNWSITTIGGDIWKVCYNQSASYKNYFKVMAPHIGNQVLKTERSLTTVPPVVSNINLGPSTAYKDTPLYCSALVTDEESDGSNVTLKWNKNGVNIYNLTWSNMTSGTLINESLNTGNLTKGDVFNCSIIAVDIDGNGGWVNSNVLTISDKPPVVNVTLLPLTPQYNNSLTCNYTYSDIDGDVLSATWIYWFKNNVLLSSLNNIPTISSGNISYSDYWMCQVKVTGTTLNSSLTNSTNTKINDFTAPTLVNDSVDLTSVTVQLPVLISVYAYDVNGLTSTKLEVTDPNTGKTNYTMPLIANNTYTLAYTLGIVGTYSFKFYAIDVAGNQAYLNASFSVTASTASSSGGGGGGGDLIVPYNGSVTVNTQAINVYYVNLKIWPFDSTKNKTSIWSYAIVTNVNLSRCSVTGNFTCKTEENRLLIFRNYTNYAGFLETSVGQVTAYKDDVAKTIPITVKLVNFGAYFLYGSSAKSMSFIPYIDVQNDDTVKFYYVPILVIGILFGILWYNKQRR